MLFIRGRLVRLLLFGGKRTKRFIRVKKIHSLSALFLVFAAAAYANTGESASIQKTDTTMLSEKIEGNYLVRRYKVIRDNDDAQYSLKYSVAASNLSALTGGNATELADLDRFIEGLKRDTSLHVRRIVITGYASPDGNPESNKALALSRAQKFRELLDSRYGLSTAYNVSVDSDAESWSECEEAVAKSSIADRARVEEILASSASDATKELQLKRMPQVWNMFRTQILPPMRRVEVNIYYNQDMVVEVHTFIEKPKAALQPKPAPRRECCCGQVVEDDIIGIIVDMGGHDDY